MDAVATLPAGIVVKADNECVDLQVTERQGPHSAVEVDGLGVSHAPHVGRFVGVTGRTDRRPGVGTQ